MGQNKGAADDKDLDQNYHFNDQEFIEDEAKESEDNQQAIT